MTVFVEPIAEALANLIQVQGQGQGQPLVQDQQLQVQEQQPQAQAQQPQAPPGAAAVQVQVDEVFCSRTSRFSWSHSSPLKRKPPKRRMFTSNTDTELLVSQTTSATEANADNCTSLAAGSSPDHNVQNDMDTQGNTTEDFKELIEKLKSLELENASLKAEIEVLKRQKGLADSRVFQLRTFTSHEDIAFYTGFPNFATFNAVYEFLNTGTNGENIRYCSSKERSVPKCFMMRTRMKPRNQRNALTKVEKGA